MTWWPIIVASVGCYLLKLIGTLIPQRWVDRPIVREALVYLPVALIVGLVVVNSVDGGSRLALDARLGGLAVAIVAIGVRAPFLVVVLCAGAATALIRLL